MSDTKGMKAHVRRVHWKQGIGKLGGPLVREVGAAGLEVETLWFGSSASQQKQSLSNADVSKSVALPATSCGLGGKDGMPSVPLPCAPDQGSSVSSQRS